MKGSHCLTVQGKSLLSQLLDFKFPLSLCLSCTCRAACISVLRDCRSGLAASVQRQGAFCAADALARFDGHWVLSTRKWLLYCTRVLWRIPERSFCLPRFASFAGLGWFFLACWLGSGQFVIIVCIELLLGVLSGVVVGRFDGTVLHVFRVARISLHESLEIHLLLSGFRSSTAAASKSDDRCVFCSAERFEKMTWRRQRQSGDLLSVTAAAEQPARGLQMIATTEERP